MPQTIIRIENLSKQYRLGVVGTRTLSGDVQRLWARIRSKEDPFLKVGEENRLDTQSGEYVWALRDINLEVKQGEVLGIIGKNGAGKSTLLKILSRVTGPTSGNIKTRGRIASLLEVGTGFHPELTGRENIFLNGAILGMTRREVKVKLDEIVTFAGVEKYLDTPVKRYSSGMYVRLAFAVAAHLEPDILVVDEVLAVGDAEFQGKAVGKMQDVSKNDGRTVLFVSHNMATIESLCTKSILLNQGKVEFEGDTDYIISNYLKRNQEVVKSLWENPDLKSDADIELLSASILDKDGNIRSSFSNMEDIFIEININILNGNEYYKVGFDLMEEGWKKLFTSFHNDCSEKQLLKEGYNKLLFKIPKHILNKGNYTVNIVSGIHRVKWIFEYKNLLGFNVIFNVINQMMPVDSRPECMVAPLLKCDVIN